MNSEVKTYRGSCHCGAVAFSFRSSEIARGKRCNCSICERSGALMSVDYYPKDAFLSLKGLESLAVYHIRLEETFVDGFERLPEAPGRLFEGANTGKLLVRV